VKRAILILLPLQWSGDQGSDCTAQLSLGRILQKGRAVQEKHGARSELEKTTIVLSFSGQQIDMAKKQLHRKSVFLSQFFSDTYFAGQQPQFWSNDYLIWG